MVLKMKEQAKEYRHVSMSVLGCLERSEGFEYSSVWEGWEVTGISVVLAYSGLLRICLAVLQDLKAKMEKADQLTPCLSFRVTVLKGGMATWPSLYCAQFGPLSSSFPF